MTFPKDENCGANSSRRVLGHASMLVLNWIGLLAVVLLTGFLQEYFRPLLDAAFNSPLMLCFHRIENVALRMTFSFCNYLGSNVVAIPLLVGLILISKAFEKTVVTNRIAAFSVGLSLMVLAAKKLINSDRPQLWDHFEYAGGSSFPSSHAAASIGIAIIIAWLLPNTRTYRFASYLVFIAALFTGAARIYFGVHRPTDVLVSWALAFSWAFLVARCYPLSNMKTI